MRGFAPFSSDSSSTFMSSAVPFVCSDRTRATGAPRVLRRWRSRAGERFGVGACGFRAGRRLVEVVFGRNVDVPGCRAGMVRGSADGAGAVLFKRLRENARLAV